MEQKVKKLPERQCLGCNTRRPKTELLRVVRAPDGTVSLDFTGKKSGRGAYICKNAACLKQARRTQRLSRNLECVIPDSEMEAMEAELEGAN